MTDPTNNPTQPEVMAGYHAWLKARAGRPFSEFESYVEGLCRYCTLEIEAGRMFWSYELPGEYTLKRWFMNYLQSRAKLKR